ncbi:hypothetical protein H6P81_011341 [Aristolochia fimbriata]|uniref:Cytochrome P450 n=1 Tax=Aristolochia fimbriata TaxID=158543 RepID=A0AAV7EU54_ARIFI|nr:hypothetical protein H6P81_011341 [Aristolochia fimbriata]
MEEKTGHDQYHDDSTSSLMASFIIVCALLSWVLIHRWNQKNRVGPKTWPVIGAALEQLRNYHRMHDWLADYLSKTRTITVQMPFNRATTYTADPANVEHILRTNFPNYPKGAMYHSFMEVLLGDGIFNADGEAWRKQRKTASLEFASKNLREFSTTVFREYAVKLALILSDASSSSTRVVLDGQDLFMRMTLDSICKVGFGVEIGTLLPELPENGFARAFDAANAIVTLRFIDPLWRLKRLLRVGSEALLSESMRIIDDFTYAVIRRRKAEMLEEEEEEEKEDTPKRHDILSRFMDQYLREEGGEKGLRDVVLNFVIAGRDTTATTLSWFVYMLTLHPPVAERLHRELADFEEREAKEKNVSLVSYHESDDENSTESRFRSRVSQFSQLLTYDTLGRMTYLHAAVNETLRLFPAVPQDPKGVLEDDVLPDGTRLKPGNMVTYVPYSMGRMDYIWGPDAAIFNPERWIRDGVLQNVSPFKFTAFQAGARICLGKDSAYLQMKMTLALLCRFFVFALVPGHEVTYRMMTILSMAHGLKLTVSRR